MRDRQYRQSTQPRYLNGMGTIQRYLYGWTVATGPVWHYITPDNIRIYRGGPAAGEPLRLPLDADGNPGRRSC